MAKRDHPEEQGGQPDDLVRTQRAIRIMVGTAFVFVAAGIALLSVITSPYARAVGVVLVVWGVGTIPTIRRFRRDRVIVTPTPEWK